MNRPSPNAEGIYSVDELKAYARSVGASEFTAAFSNPALLFGADIAEPASGSAIEKSIRRTVMADQDDKTSRVPSIKPSSRLTNAMAFLQKRKGNPFPHMISLGRAMNNDIVILNASVSKLHGYFLREGESWFFTDHKSSNGTQTNGARVEPGKKTSLADRDRFRFGLDVTATLLFPKAVYSCLREGG